MAAIIYYRLSSWIYIYVYNKFISFL